MSAKMYSSEVDVADRGIVIFKEGGIARQKLVVLLRQPC